MRQVKGSFWVLVLDKGVKEKLTTARDLCWWLVAPLR